VKYKENFGAWTHIHVCSTFENGASEDRSVTLSNFKREFRAGDNTDWSTRFKVEVLSIVEKEECEGFGF